MKIFYGKIVISALSAAALLCFSGCGLFSDDSSSEITSAVDSTEDRHIETTQTGRYAIDAEGADEELSGFTTTKEPPAETLENPVPDEPDSDIIATAKKTWYTTTTTTAAKKTTAEKTKKPTKKTPKETAFKADKLHAPTEAEKFKSKKKYKVTSDTTYLNLRFGPSKKYEVQLKIPDGKTIYGTAKTKTDGEGWIYVTFKGTSGWVMEALMKAE